MAQEIQKKALAVTALGVLATSVALAGCGAQSPAPGDNADTQSQSSQSSNSSKGNSSSDIQETLTNEMNFPTAATDTGNYADGTYYISGTYGEHSASTLKVSATLSQGKISALTVTPQTTNAISKKYGDSFVQSIQGQVVGKDIKDLKLDTVAGASWTTEAFNAALTNIRGEASQAAAQ